MAVAEIMSVEKKDNSTVTREVSEPTNSIGSNGQEDLRGKIKGRLKVGKTEDEYIIRERASDYIVYIDVHDNLRWEIGSRASAHASKEKVDVLANIEYLSSFPTEYLDNKQLFSWARMVAHAISLITYKDGNKKLDEPEVANINGAKRIIEYAEMFITTRTKEKARIWMIESSVFASMVLFGVLFFLSHLVVSGHLSLGLSRIPGLHLKDYDFLLLLVSMGSGIVGAQFSVLTRLYEIKVDPAAGRWVHWGEAIIRIMTGMVSAIIVYVILQSNIATSLLSLNGHMSNDIGAALIQNVAGTPTGIPTGASAPFETEVFGKEVWILAFISVLAGFSERFIPSFLDKIEDESFKKKPKSQGDAG